MAKILVKILCFAAAIMAIELYASNVLDMNSMEASTRQRIVLGLSKIELNQNMTAGVQVDRIIRAVRSENSSINAGVPADRIPKNASQIVDYMEGARVREMMNWSKVRILPLTPARAKKCWSNESKSYKYFAADGRGNFPFLISESKFMYLPFNKTAFSPASGSLETADIILPDTHGFNMVAEQAYLRRQDIDLAVACMDLPSKASAALYLAKGGIDIYAPCDRFAYELLNYREKFGINSTILGSAPIKQTPGGAIIGDQPLAIYSDEPVVVEYTDRGYPDQYCDAPWRYFNRLKEVYGLQLPLIKVQANAGQAGIVVKQAQSIKAHVIGVRICEEDDYRAVAEWLKKDPRHRAVLLHSAGYEPGNTLFKEFSNQTTFGDLMPVIETCRYGAA